LRADEPSRDNAPTKHEAADKATDKKATDKKATDKKLASIG
jgi:hypothetical protein